METRAPFGKGVEHVAEHKGVGVTSLTSSLNHLQYTYFLYIPFINHNLCKPKSTMFVYFSHTADCSFFKENT